MKVAVLGAGAIGAYVGAMLARGGTETALIARGAHGAAMADYGVRLLGDGAEVAVRMPVTDDPGQVGRVDVVFLGLKAHQYAAAEPLLDPLLGPETAVVAAQNGIPWWYFHGHGGPHDGRRIDSVDPGGAVSGVIPPERAIGCVVYASTEIVEPGVIRHIEDIRFPVGEPAGGTSDRCAAFSAAMRAGGLKAPVARDIRQQIWLKLMGNAVFNPLSVLTRATMGEICASGPARGAAERMMCEVVEVAAALGRAPRVSVAQRMAGAAAVGDHRTSMLQDFEAGKPLELDALLGAVIELADLTGVDAPALRTVHGAMDLVAGRRPPRLDARGPR
ncbi:MAG: 2-dehydropantoate 2-reductase [Solirubrobacteraceae bacterium]